MRNIVVDPSGYVWYADNGNSKSLFDVTKGAEPMKGSEAKLALWKFNFEVKGTSS